ncbi:tRNA (guanosine(37)-N1)-methyltransferase TrmD [Sedimenticola sp.]|uniref:tRNA (guanosine(37)-N1)-methyltransferase TrmD n=1 Tax=Sedimenticola sp. TaxID=1940285 RepID=UPI0025907092|nr:tRNA (guanosine(37)-N1)-methyltransferase TrmD [Sedimenticola sp.]MCW8902653.1 tRNA (guanosine(37)-N1)-methyltransferase TrmD [Sedimenticola sp.]
MRFDVVTLFPEMFRAMIGEGVTGRAMDRGQVSLGLWNPRDYTHDVHRTVDDRPYGGGPGMVMKMEPLRDAIAQARQVAPDSAVAYLSPQGRRFDQAAAGRMASRSGMILIAGRYEGIDERLISRYVDEEWSIGDYVLSGGELPALVLMDAVIRLIPGVLGDKDSAEQDSFADGLLDCPHYTRPEVFEGDQVPSILLGGNHELIRRWRLQQSLGRTWQRRPDLLEGRVLSQEEEILLNEFIQAHTSAD